MAFISEPAKEMRGHKMQVVQELKKRSELTQFLFKILIELKLVF